MDVALMVNTSIERSPDLISKVLAALKPRITSTETVLLDGNKTSYSISGGGLRLCTILLGSCLLVTEDKTVTLLEAGDCLLHSCNLNLKLLTVLPEAPSGPSIHNNGTSAVFAHDCYIERAAHVTGATLRWGAENADLLFPIDRLCFHLPRSCMSNALQELVGHLRCNLIQSEPGAQFFAEAMAFVMFVQVLRHMATRPHQPQFGWLLGLFDQKLQAALICIHSKPGEVWSVSSLAASVGMARSVFAARFHSMLGVTPLEYLTRWRMLLASDILRRKPLCLQMISNSLGYRSESAFGRAFRRTVGLLPREYARSRSTSATASAYG